MNITVVRNETELRALVARWEAERPELISVDCEWHGKTHVDGQLRTAQFAWTQSDVAVVVFRDEWNVFSFVFAEPRRLRWLWRRIVKPLWPWDCLTTITKLPKDCV